MKGRSGRKRVLDGLCLMLLQSDVNSIVRRIIGVESYWLILMILLKLAALIYFKTRVNPFILGVYFSLSNYRSVKFVLLNCSTR